MSHNLIIFLLLVVFGWRIYVRLRRNIGRQPFRAKRLKGYIVIFILLSAGFAIYTQGHRPLVIGWLCGVILGSVLAVWGLSLSRLETTPEGRFFTPNGHIGVGLTVLFVGRLVYRVIVVYSHVATSQGPPPGQSALTIMVFELLAAYYIVYYAGVFRRFAAEPQKA